MKKTIFKLLSMLMICIILAGCGKAGGSGSQTSGAGDATEASQGQQGGDTAPGSESGGQGGDTAPGSESGGQGGDTAPGSGNDGQSDSTVQGSENSQQSDDKTSTGSGGSEGSDAKGTGSLAKRMAGKYSYDLAGSDPEQDECLIMEVVTFGDNLYAYCGSAMRDEDHLEAYSYWATEFIPEAADDMSDVSSKSVEVYELRFSNMSNAGKYWDSGRKGMITLTDEGLLFEGFGNDGFLCDENGDGRLFVKDYRVEDAFPYANSVNKTGSNSNNAGGDADLQGLWVTEGKGAPVYLDVNGSDLTVYKKLPSEEVLYAGFGCEISDGRLSGTGNYLGCGSMPYELQARYSVEGDRLTLDNDSDPIIDELSGKTVFMRASEKIVPVITMDDIVFNEDSFGPIGEMSFVPDLDQDEYYGVFLAAFKSSDECIDTELKLEEAGYHLCPIVYTPDFSQLNPEPYYVVSAGLYTTEKRAQEVLKDVQQAGFKDAYVKNAGRYIGGRCQYTMYGGEQIRVLDDHIALLDVSLSIPYITDAEPVKTDLYVYKDAVFDSSAELEFFGNYEKGDTPYEWIARNYKLKSSDPDKYIENGPALSGVFEVSLEDSRITRYYGSYWWD